MTFRGRVQNGVVVFPDPIPVPDGAEVDVTFAPSKDAASTARIPKTLSERLKNVIGKAKNLPPDTSVNVDHYLYGLPKK